MKALIYKVRYENEPDTVVELPVKPRHLIKQRRQQKADEKAGVEVDTLEEGYKLVWIAAETPLSFDDWMALVADIETPDIDFDAVAAADEKVVDPAGSDEPVPTSSPSLD